MTLVSIHKERKTRLDSSEGRVKRPLKPTPDNPVVVSASELSTFLRCRVKWNWRYQHRIVPIERPHAFSFGDAVHNIIERWYLVPEKNRTPERIAKIAKKQLRLTNPEELSLDDLELIKAMVTGYADYAGPRDAELRLRNVKPEDMFELPLNKDGSILIRGKIDLHFRVGSMKNTMGLFEHKTASQIRNDTLDLNMQLSVYLWALRQMYPKKKRFIGWRNVLRKQMPGPRVRAALFARMSVERTDEEIDQWAVDTERVVFDMLDAAIYPNPTKDCSWDCDFQVPCLLRGTPDVKGVLATNFKKKEPYDGGR